MAKLKTQFDLERIGGNAQNMEARIVGTKPEYRPYVCITITDGQGYTHCVGIKDKDLERFAVNILKALGSKKVK